MPKNASCLLSDLLTTVAIIIDSYGRQVPIYFSMSQDICNEIITDNEWVWQMLLNLLTNACKHTDEGSVHVNVSVCSEYPAGRKRERASLAGAETGGTTEPSPGRSRSNSSSHASDQQQLLFQIVDSGVGVDAAKHDSLFEVFSQAQSGQSAGTGLGLFSVYSRCSRLGGACGVISPNNYPVGGGEGSTFWFTVPYLPAASHKWVEAADFSRYPTPHVLCDSCQAGGMVVMGIDVTWDRKERDSDERESSATQSTTAQAGGDAAGGGDADTKACLPYTAFVVDDVQSIRKLLKRTLLGLGFTRVELFENGKRALDAMKKEVVDVVFMDIQVGGASICAVLLGLRMQYMHAQANSVQMIQHCSSI